MFKSPASFSDVRQGTLVVSSHMGFVCLLVSKFVVVHFAWKIEEEPPHSQTSCMQFTRVFQVVLVLFCLLLCECASVVRVIFTHSSSCASIFFRIFAFFCGCCLLPADFDGETRCWSLAWWPMMIVIVQERLSSNGQEHAVRIRKESVFSVWSHYSELLPPDIRTSDSHHSLRRSLKSLLFREAFTSA